MTAAAAADKIRLGAFFLTQDYGRSQGVRRCSRPMLH